MKFLNNNFILIDGSYFLYRSYYSYYYIVNNKGQKIGAIYGILNLIYKILLNYKPYNIVIIFDHKGKNFRHNLFKQYKKNRKTMPYDLILQINSLYKIIKKIGISILSIKNVEADDVIGTLAIKAEKLGFKVLIISLDKDFFQLVSDNIFIFNIIDNKILNLEKIKLKFGVYPELIVDYLSLIGDKSDNIPGVPGIGKQTAKIILNKLGNLKNIYIKIDNLKILNIKRYKFIKNQLIKYKKLLFLYHKLIKIKTNIKFKFNFLFNKLLLKNIKDNINILYLINNL